jgi:hypothetical protein
MGCRSAGEYKRSWREGTAKDERSSLIVISNYRASLTSMFIRTLRWARHSSATTACCGLIVNASWKSRHHLGFSARAYDRILKRSEQAVARLDRERCERLATVWGIDLICVGGGHPPTPATPTIRVDDRVLTSQVIGTTSNDQLSDFRSTLALLFTRAITLTCGCVRTPVEGPRAASFPGPNCDVFRSQL